jgi:glycosyltransferase involved in cell wall biosynthesis
MFWAMLWMRPRSAVFSPGFNVPLFVVRPFIFMIYDLNHIDLPENSSVLKRLYYEYIMKRACKNAYRVLTISEFSRMRVLDWSKIRGHQVINVGGGVDEKFSPEGACFNPGYPYLLCVSNRRPHKNEIRIIRAFARARIDPRVRLVFTGQSSDELLEISSSLGIRERVIFVGRVIESDLPGLYRGAISLIFPSLYEGLGLPVIEAMACGTPVLTSRTTSLLEVAADAALLVDPLSVSDISNGIERLSLDPDLRDFYREKGFLRAKSFSWDAVVSKVMAVLKGMEGELLK